MPETDKRSRAASAIQRGERQLQAGRYREAAVNFQEALRMDSRDFTALHGLGVALANEGDLLQSERFLRQAVQIDPGSVEVRNSLGLILGKMNRFADAAAQFNSALRALPGDVGTLRNLGMAHEASGNRQAAIACFAEAVRALPDDLLLVGTLGTLLVATGSNEEAVPLLQKVVAANPGDDAARIALGRALILLSRFEEAVTELAAACQRQPDDFEAQHNLGLALCELGRFSAAAECFRRAIALDGRSSGAFNGLGIALQGLGADRDALAAHTRAVALDPSHAAAHQNLGDLLGKSGDFAAAQAHFEAAVTLEPRRGAFLRSLATVKKFHLGDGRLAVLESAARDIAALPGPDQMELHFALGKAYDDLGRLDESFQHLVQANRLKRVRTHYDEARALALIDRIRTVYTADLLRAKAGLGDASDVPVFIVGMPRSGTSLVEQIFASHPEVHGAGEVTALEDSVRMAVPDIPSPATTPELVRSISQRQLADIGAYYVSALRARQPAAGRITNKLPANFLHVGLIRLALPTARIIHVRRDPIDTCLSCFSQLFSGGNLPYTYDLRELGRFYRAYQGLMNHWRAVLEPQEILEVRYEDLVADLERSARQMLAYCGLPWDDSCLSFYKTRRPVQTASFVGVRQPVFQSSVGRSRALRGHLQPLIEELGLGAD